MNLLTLPSLSYLYYQQRQNRHLLLCHQFDFTKHTLGKPTLERDCAELPWGKEKILFPVLSGLYQKHLKIRKTSVLL